VSAPKGNKRALGNAGNTSNADKVKYQLPELLEKAQAGEYTPAMLPLIQRMAMLGMTDAEIASWLGVAPGTFRRYCLIYPELTEVLKAGKDISDNFVERSLYMKAIGYSYKTTKHMVVDKMIQQVEEEVHVQPSTSAAIFWLKNRRPDAWKDVQKHEHGAAGEFDNLSDEEVAQRLAQMVGQQPQQTEQPAPGISRKRGDKLN
jgi:hypothetical protein